MDLRAEEPSRAEPRRDERSADELTRPLDADDYADGVFDGSEQQAGDLGPLSGLSDAEGNEGDELIDFDLANRREPETARAGFRWYARVWGGSLSTQDDYDAVNLNVVGSDSNTVHYDFDDRHNFNVRLEEAQGETSRELPSVELSFAHLWDERGRLVNRWPAWQVNLMNLGAGLEFGRLPVADRTAPRALPERALAAEPPRWRRATYAAYGLRYANGVDEYRFRGNTDLLGNTFVDTQVEHPILGPQFVLGRVASRDRWATDVSVRLLLGYGEANTGQHGGIGEEAIPGGSNNSAVLQPTITSSEQSRRQFAQLLEVRCVASYFFREHWSADLMARAYVTGPWYEASSSVGYTLPNYTLNQDPPSDYFSGANLLFGVSYLR
ncbi:MAG: hypothetical protein AAGG46_03500 [Planctomycetota bacterium]